MSRLRPSLAQLAILVATTLMVPPLLAVGTATVELEQLARDSEETVRRAARGVELSRALSEHAQGMERYARQFDALEDPRYDALYRARRADFRRTAAELTEISDPSKAAHLAVLLDEERQAHARLSGDDPAARPQALGELAAITEASREQFDAAAGSVATSTRAVASAAAEMQQDLLLLSVVLLPLLGLAAAAMNAVLLRPMRTLDVAIRELGRGEMDAPIDVGGTDDMRRLGERLEWLRTRMLAVESDRVRLFRHVSHELKTPLACIREGTELLTDGVPDPPTPAQSELLAILRSNAQELQTRIEDILRVSAIRRGDTVLQPESLDLGELVRRGVERHAVQARSQGIALRLETPPSAVRADRHKVATAIDNLLSNALKFSPPGGTVTAIVRPGPTHSVEVTDQGPGIPAEDRERVFEAFYRGADAIGVPGTGLGLSIAREYARAHGGDVVLQPIPRGAPGTSFLLTLPGETS